jgi:tRNA dimethylallyltransferase
MNLYRGMDIGTAKPTPEERARVEYAGIDLCDPTEKFSVAAYLEAVRPVFHAGREVIVAGGTGLYIKCLTEGFDDVPPENPELRAELEALGFDELEQRAKALAEDLYSGLTADDRMNPRRLIRILEMAAADPSAGRDGPPGRPPVSRSWNAGPQPVLAGLHVEREALHRRIEKRVGQMYADGLLDEAGTLMDLDLSETALQAIGYAEAFAVLKNEMTLEQAKEQTVIRTRQLAKRQMTWFRNQLKVEWIDVAGYPDLEKLAQAVSNAWEKLGPVPIQI